MIDLANGMMWMAAEQPDQSETVRRLDWETIGRLVRERAGQLVRQRIEVDGGVRMGQPLSTGSRETGRE